MSMLLTMTTIDRADDAATGSMPVAANAWIRKRHRTLGFAMCAFLNSALWIWMLVFTANKPRYAGRSGELASIVLFFLAVALASAALGWRLARCGLWIGPAGIVVRGPLRTWRLAVQDVERIEPGVQRPGDAGNGTPCPILKLANGRAIGVWALGGEGLVFSYHRLLENMQPLCDDLNRLLEDVRPADCATVVGEHSQV
jgi:hypothetical protein